MTIAKELAKPLKECEAEIISLAIFHNYKTGSIGNVEWELEINYEAIDEDLHQGLGTYISRFINTGTYEDKGIWKFSFKRYKGLAELELENYQGKLSI